MRRSARDSSPHLYLALLSCCGVYAGTIGGTVTRIPSGSPVPSASIRLCHAGQATLVAEMETDSNGRFHADDLLAGEYTIEVTAPNHARTWMTLDLSDLDDRSSLAIPLLQYGVITGTVHDENGEPVSGATVVALRSEGDREFVRASAIVASDGHYRLHGLSPGSYRVAASYGLSAFSLGSTGGTMTNPRLGSGVLFHPGRGESMTLDPGGELTGIDFVIRLGPRHTMSGKVDLEVTEGRFWVSLVQAQEPGLSFTVVQTRTDGRFDVSGIAAGYYHVLASGPVSGRGARGAVLAMQPVFQRSQVQVPITSPDGVALTPEPPRSRTFALKSVEVGACPADWAILLQPAEGWGTELERRVPARLDTETIVTGLAPTTYFVSLEAADSTCYPEPTPPLRMASSAGLSDPVVLRVHPALSLLGRLASLNSRTDDISIVLLSQASDTLQIELADARGNFKFRHLRPGSYRILTHPPIYREQRIEIDQQTPATITLERPDHTANPHI